MFQGLIRVCVPGHVQTLALRGVSWPAAWRLCRTHPQNLWGRAAGASWLRLRAAQCTPCEELGEEKQQKKLLPVTTEFWWWHYHHMTMKRQTNSVPVPNLFHSLCRHISCKWVLWEPTDDSPISEAWCCFCNAEDVTGHYGALRWWVSAGSFFRLNECKRGTCTGVCKTQEQIFFCVMLVTKREVKPSQTFTQY